jgi:hypothetical protein
VDERPAEANLRSDVRILSRRKAKEVKGFGLTPKTLDI